MIGRRFIRSVARREFGRRGYEITTVRDIAAAAGLGSGSVYRVIGSKEELLASIMNGFADKTMAGWNAALDSDSTIVEKLDAAAWLQINVMERFHDEFRIQLAWMRQVPPDMPRFGWSVPALLRRLKSELAAGAKSGQIRADGVVRGAHRTLRHRPHLDPGEHRPGPRQAQGTRHRSGHPAARSCDPGRSRRVSRVVLSWCRSARCW